MSTSVTPERFIELSSFAIAYAVLHDTEVLVPEDRDALLSEGRVIGTRSLRFFEEMQETFYEDLLAADSQLRTADLIQIKGDPASRIYGHGLFLRKVFGLMKKRGSASTLTRVVFKNRGKAQSLVVRVGQASMMEDPSCVRELSLIPIKAKKLRTFVQTVALACGVEPDEFSTIIADTEVAKSVAEDIVHIDQQIRVSDPQSEESVVLKEQRQKKVEKIKEVARDSFSPEAVMSTAMTTITQASKNQIAMNLGLTSDQEEAMLLSGNCVIAAGAGSGKCVSLDTLVPTKENGIVPIGDFVDEVGGLRVDQDKPLVKHIHGREGVEATKSIYFNGLQDVKRIKTRYGYSLTATPNHRILVMENGKINWVRMDELRAGDYCCIDRRPGVFAESPFCRPTIEGTRVPTELTPQVATLLGYLVSRGHVKPGLKNLISIKTSDMEQFALYQKSMQGIFFERGHAKEEAPQGIRIHEKKDIEALYAFGLTPALPHYKTVPQGVLQSPKPVIKNFLSALFDGDGSVRGDTLTYTSTSEILVHQTQILLLNFGVISKQRLRVTESDFGLAWTLDISGDDLRTFAQEIGFNLRHKQALVEEICQKKVSTNVDVIPTISGLCRQVVETYTHEHGTNQDRESRYDSFQCGQRMPSHSGLSDFLDLYSVPNDENWETLKSYVGKWFFDPVDSIEDDRTEVADFVVPGTHSFSANGFINHNTKTLSAKIVYTIQELGVAPENMIVTSFSRKASAEILRRASNDYGAGGEDMIKRGMDTMGTSHSVAGKIMRKYAKGRIPLQVLADWEQKKLVTLAMAQVSMDSQWRQEPPDTQSFFDTNVLRELSRPRFNSNRGYGGGGGGYQKRWRRASDKEIHEFHVEVASCCEEQQMETPPEVVEMLRLSSLYAEFNVPKSPEDLETYEAFYARMDKAGGTGKEAGQSWRDWEKNAAGEWFNLGIKLPRMQKEYALYITNCKGKLISPSQAWALDGSDPEIKDFPAVYAAYEWLKNNTDDVFGKRDHDDTLIYASQLMIMDSDVREAMQDRITHVFIDEAQDLNKSQHLLFGLIAGTYDPTTQEPYPDGRKSVETMCFIGDDKQCVDLNTLVDTPQGRVPIKNLSEGSEVLAYRNGQVVPQTVSVVQKSQWEYGIEITTKEGHTLLMSPTHKLWATEPVVKDGEVCLYLMYRFDLGFRLGVTNKGDMGRGESYLDSYGRLGKADKMWILKICESQEEALYQKENWSLQYGVPTIPWDQRIFADYGHNGSQLLKDLHLQESLPHWISSSHSKQQRTIQLLAHSSHSTQVSLEWWGDDLDDKLKGIQFKKSRIEGGRILRRSFADYREGRDFAGELQHRTGALLSQRLSTPEGALRKITASGLHVGMQVPILANHEIGIVLEEVTSIRIVKDCEMVGISVVGASNFIGNHILTSNSIYEFRGATPQEFVSLSDEVPGGQQYKTKKLDMNFRSGGKIVHAANQLIAHNDDQIPMVCQPSPFKGEGSIVAVSVADNKDGAALTAGDIVAGIADGDSYSDYGVALRTNREAWDFCLEMVKNQIPFKSKHNPFRNPLLRSLRHWLDLIDQGSSTNHDPNIVNEAILNAHKMPTFFLSRAFNDALQSHGGGDYLTFLMEGGWRKVYTGRNEWRNKKFVKPYLDTILDVMALGKDSNILGDVEEAFNALLNIQGLKNSIEEELLAQAGADTTSGDEDESLNTPEGRREAALRPVLFLKEIYQGQPDFSKTTAYLRDLERVSQKTNVEEEEVFKEAVVVDTVHGWKGLECKYLYTSMAAGKFPHAKSTTPDKIRSERRLAYVAITRGEQRVVVLAPEMDEFGKAAGPSVFISEACIPMEGRGSTRELPGKQASEIVQKQVRAYLSLLTQGSSDLLISWNEVEKQ